MSKGFAMQGATLVLLARRVERLELLSAELNKELVVKVVNYKCYVRDPKMID